MFKIVLNTSWSLPFLVFFLYETTDKTGFYECVETRYFFILANNSRSKQNKKNPTHYFVDIGK